MANGERPVYGDMTMGDYMITVHQHHLSDYAESCPFEGEDDHECDGECRWLDGDRREVRTSETEEFTPDADDIELADGSVVKWAVELLRGGKFPALYASSSPIQGVQPHKWLHGTEEHMYREEYTEYSVYLSGGGWTTEMRTEVFKGANWS